MPRSFDITDVPATESIRVDASGKAKIVFTVSNALKRPVRVTATPQVSGDMKPEWVRVEKPAEQYCTADGTLQFTVNVELPAGTPPGDYRVSLVAADADNADERYDESAAVKIEVPKTEAKKKRFPWWIVAVAAGVVAALAVGVGLWVGTKKKPGLLDPCEEEKACASGLVCGGEGLCLGEVGFEGCKVGDQCASGVCSKEGVCAPEPPGSPCKPGKVCPEEQECSKKNVCLGVAGFKGCESGDQCVTGECDAGVCTATPPGVACAAAEPRCPPRQKCSVLGALELCLLEPGEPCKQDIECSSTWCKNQQCSRDDGVCAAAGDCRAPFACMNGKCLLPPGAKCSDDVLCATGYCDKTCVERPQKCFPECEPGMMCTVEGCKPFALLYRTRMRQWRPLTVAP